MFKCGDNNNYKIPFPSNNKLLDILLKNDAETNLKIFSLGISSIMNDASNNQVNKDFGKKYKLLKGQFNKIVTEKNNEIFKLKTENNEIQLNYKILNDDYVKCRTLLNVKDSNIDSLNNTILDYEQRINVLKDNSDDEKKYFNNINSVKDQTIDILNNTINNLRISIDNNNKMLDNVPIKMDLLELQIINLKNNINKDLEYKITFENLQFYLSKFNLQINNLTNDAYCIFNQQKSYIFLSQSQNKNDSANFIDINNNYIGGILINNSFKNELTFSITKNGKLLILTKYVNLNNNELINSINFILFWYSLYKNDNLGSIVSNTQIEFNNLQDDLNNLSNIFYNLTNKSNQIKDIIFNKSGTIVEPINNNVFTTTLIESINNDSVNSSETIEFSNINEQMEPIQIYNFIELSNQHTTIDTLQDILSDTVIDTSLNLVNIPNYINEEQTNEIKPVNKKNKTNSRKPRKNKKDIIN